MSIGGLPEDWTGLDDDDEEQNSRGHRSRSSDLSPLAVSTGASERSMPPSFARLNSRGRLFPHGSFHFLQLSGLHVIDESSYRNVLWNPGMRFYSVHLLPYVLFEIIEGVEVGGFAGDRAHLFG